MTDQPNNNNEFLYQTPQPNAEANGENTDGSATEEATEQPEYTTYQTDPESKPEKKGWSKKNKFLAIAGIAAAGIGAGVGGTLALGQSKDKPVKPSGGVAASASPSTKPSAEASPSVAPTPETEEITVENLELDASLIKDPEALSRAFNDELLTKWYNAGATPENAKLALRSNTETIDEVAARIAAEYDKKFIEAVLIKDWESDRDLVEMVNNITTGHRQTLTLYFYTAPIPGVDSDPQDIEGYRRWTEVISIDSVNDQTDTSVRINSTTKDYDNADLNRVGEDLTDGKKVGEAIGKDSSTYIIENGKVKLSRFSWVY